MFSQVANYLNYFGIIYNLQLQWVFGVNNVWVKNIWFFVSKKDEIPSSEGKYVDLAFVSWGGLLGPNVDLPMMAMIAYRSGFLFISLIGFNMHVQAFQLIWFFNKFPSKYSGV